MFIVWFLMMLLDRPLSLLIPRNKKERLRRLKLSIAIGTLALLSGCGAFYSQQKVSVDHTSCLRHSEETLPEEPAPKWELTIPDHPAIDNWVSRFSGKNHSSFQTQLDRAHFYAAPAQEIFERKGLPKDLIYVALVESGFSPTARSHANAVGMWQIVSKTGNRFGLEQNKWVDERRHPMKAAKAAANYLSLLYDQFGSWSLALAAYNAGENAVQGTLDKSGLKTFWDLLDNGYLPAETRDYVPKVFAAVKIIRSPDLYGFRLDSEHFIARHETVRVRGGLKLSWVGKQIGVPEELLQNCNPELCQSTTPPGCSNYELCLPIGTADDLLTALARHAQQEEKTVGKAAMVPRSPALTSYRVKSGDTWSSLARRHECSVTALVALNGMKSSQPLKAGQALKLPSAAPSPSISKVQAKPGKGSTSTASSSEKSPSNAQQKSVRSAAPSPSISKVQAKRGNDSTSIASSSKKSFSDAQKSVRYLVRPGDTLSSIAGKFHVPVKTLCAQNRVSTNQKLTPGNILTICTSHPDSSQPEKKRVN
jgi:membrane-bound lytic murein transglycosylase D